MSEKIVQLLSMGLKALVKNAQRDGLMRPYQIGMTDGNGAVVQPDRDPEFPVELTLTDVDGREASITIEAEASTKPKFDVN